MRSVTLHTQWAYRHLDSNEVWQDVTIPHDAMLSEPRYEQAISGINSGWYDGRDYEYVRTISLADLEECADVTQSIDDGADKGIYVLEFEGVYQHARVYLDDREIAYRPYGYTNFTVDISEQLRDGKPHRLRVIARNADQPNSRWYSGAGIYRPVRLWYAYDNAIDIDGLYMTTESIDGVEQLGRIARIAHISAVAETRKPAHVIFELTDRQGSVVATGEADSTDNSPAHVVMTVHDAQLWDTNHPYLYTLRARLEKTQDAQDSHEDLSGHATYAILDEATTQVGIRTLEWGNEGILLNGKRVIVQGACIHHDNGVLGARAYEDAEWRKVALMQRAGYNALRSAHNPCSKEMLRACDSLGMLMMDEYIDHWYIHKTQYDYVEFFEDWWRHDITDMVRKDRSHPSVIMYSTGNEVSETAQKRGIELTQQLTDFIHELDATRPVTCGINIFFNFLSSIGMGVYSDVKAQAEVDNAAKNAVKSASKESASGATNDTSVSGAQVPDETGRSGKAVGSQFFNDMAGVLGADFMKTGATLPMCDWKTKDAFAAMDIAGYNYGIKRYRHDLKKYPNRLILGSETFCSDAYRFRELAKKNPRLVGDFVWAGMDYMGEVGVGAWEYADYAPRPYGFGWRTAGSGRIDLIGQDLGEALYTKVALEAEDGPFIAVCPVNHTKDKHSPSAWKMSNAIPSWSWDGCEGKKAKVEVYARAFSVALFVNGHEVGRKKMRNDCIARFTCAYEPGTIEAVAYDKQSNEIGRTSLTSATGPTELRAVAESINGDITRYVSFGGGAGEDVISRQDISDDATSIVSEASSHETTIPALRKGHLAFIRLQYCDEHGVVKPLERGRLTVNVDGGTLVGLGSAAPFTFDSYTENETGTYYGQALAVVQAQNSNSSAIRVHVSDGERTTQIEIPVEQSQSANVQ
ncbi:glycoside hydrolase family 2 protein [Alloscardovia theropitheci]|uniref:Glycoside hydrolase family 2 protein n=1 Tax=Alloscardovia theropitheci TaxID=2496842 RepID=A0A4R0QNT5_9BIFI|nr:glycoside hydrolase family 2 TIM barrel-domain containing protein [Alloscardovia theropitheci]TCD53872.1 glycoside hydrolase family 2 protein [Alloscardovia theropitheci]